MATASEIQAIVNEFNRLLLPAKLANTKLNGKKIALWVEEFSQDGGISACAADMLEAAKHVYASLEWQPGFEPAVLIRDKEAQKTQKIVPAFKQSDEFATKVKAAAALEARKLSDEKNLRAARALVAAYLPVNRQGRIEHGKQAETQKILNDYLDRQPANVDTSDVLSKVQKYIADKYREAEKAAERV